MKTLLFTALLHTIPFTVERIVDGDTIDGVAHIWPEIELHTLVRLRGIDTPEKASKIGARATALTDSLIRTAQQVWLTDPKTGKFAGRIIADVWIDSTLLASVLIQRELAKPYDGRSKRPDWNE